MTHVEINNYADKVYHAKMEDIPYILEELIKNTQSKMYSREEIINIQKKYSKHCYDADNNPFTSDEIIPFEKWLKIKI